MANLLSDVDLSFVQICNLNRKLECDDHQKNKRSSPPKPKSFRGSFACDDTEIFSFSSSVVIVNDRFIYSESRLPFSVN